MIKKLRRKFITVSMLAVLLVLAIIMGSINILNYFQVVQDADEVLALLAENEGSFPKSTGIVPERNNKMAISSPELAYETRYFTVLFNQSGDLIQVDTGKIAAVSSESAILMASQVTEAGRTKGFFGPYRFLVSTDGAQTRVIFVDCNKSLDSFQGFLYTSLGISLVGFVTVFLLILYASRWVVRPVSESYEKQRRFITDAGHELKTPLTIIDADTEVLSMDVGDDNEWIGDIRKQTKRLATLTNDLIMLSRMEEDDSRMQMLEFPLSDVVEETAGSFQALALTQGKEFTMRVEPMLSYCGEEKSIRQLVSILLDNALKYSGEAGKISLILEKQGKHFKLSVRNTAPGFTGENGGTAAQEKLLHLFDRFYRGDQARSPEISGYGIGLSIAQAIVSNHRGKISAELLEGTDLQITVILPERKAGNDRK